MTTQLDLKKLTKSMDFTDKMKILLEDINVYAESLGEKTLLSPFEKQSFYDTMQKDGQINDYNRIYGMYKVVNLMVIDTIISSQALQITLLEMSRFLTAGIVKGILEDTIDEILYDLATEGYSVEDREKKDIQDKIDKKRNDLTAKYHLDSPGLVKEMDYFTPSVEHKSYFSTELKHETLEVNPQIQELFMEAVEGAKRFNETIYEVEYALSLIGFNCLSTRQQKDLQIKKDLLKSFTELEGILRLLRIYRDNPFKTVTFTCKKEPLFLETIRDITATVDLNDSRKVQAKKAVDKAIKAGL